MLTRMPFFISTVANCRKSLVSLLRLHLQDFPSSLLSILLFTKDKNTWGNTRASLSHVPQNCSVGVQDREVTGPYRPYLWRCRTFCCERRREGRRRSVLSAARSSIHLETAFVSFPALSQGYSNKVSSKKIQFL